MPRGLATHPVPANKSRTGRSPTSRLVGGSPTTVQPAPLLDPSVGIPHKNNAMFGPSSNWASYARSRSLPHYTSGLPPSRTDQGYYRQNASSRESSLTNTPSVYHRQLPGTPLQMLQRNIQQQPNPKKIPFTPSFAVNAPSTMRGFFQPLPKNPSSSYAQQPPLGPSFNSAPVNNSANRADPRLSMSSFNSVGTPQNTLSYRESRDGTPTSAPFRADQSYVSYGTQGASVPNFQHMANGTPTNAPRNFGSAPIANPIEQRMPSKNQQLPQMGELILEEIRPRGASFSWLSYRDNAPAPVLLVRSINQEFQAKFHHVEGNIFSARASLPPLELECSLVDTPMPPLVIPQRKFPERWSVNDVLFFVRTLNIPSILPQISTFHIDGQTLQTLCENDMAELGVEAPFLQRRFLDFVHIFFGSPYGPRMRTSSVQSRTAHSPIRASGRSRDSQSPVRPSIQSHTFQQHVQPAGLRQLQTHAQSHVDTQTQARAQDDAIKQIRTQIASRTQKPAQDCLQVSAKEAQARVVQQQAPTQPRVASQRQIPKGNLHFSAASPHKIAPMDRSFEAGRRVDDSVPFVAQRFDSPQIHPQMNLQQMYGGRDDATPTQLARGQETTPTMQRHIATHSYTPSPINNATRTIIHAGESSTHQRHLSAELSSVSSGSALYNQDRIPRPTPEGSGQARTSRGKTHPEHGAHRSSDWSTQVGGDLIDGRQSAMSNAISISSSNSAGALPARRSTQSERSTIGDSTKRNSTATDRMYIVSCRGRIGA